MKAIEGMQPQINDMERRLGIMQSVEPVLENAIKTLQKVIDVRGMGASQITAKTSSSTSATTASATSTTTASATTASGTTATTSTTTPTTDVIPELAGQIAALV